MKHLRGSVLIEGLIAMTIFAIGVLGLTSLQTSLKVRDYDAKLRVLASEYAGELIGMAVSDPKNKNCYTIPVNSQVGCASATAKALAQDWQDQVTATIPNISANNNTATLSASNNFKVTINWQRTSSQSLHTYSATTRIIN
jgi:type IV pilus assembly protein PilV